MENLTISDKQRHAIGLLENPSAVEIFMGGSGGGSKTFTMAIMVLLTIRQYPGCRLFVGRKTLKSLRQSFIQTLLGQVHKMFNLVEDQDFNYSAQLGEIKYNNGSTVIFGELMKNPSDPDFSRFGSLELDMAFIEEAGEVTLEAKNAIRSRVGRGIMAKEHSLPGKLVLSGNPSQNFLRTEYYDPYMELGGGEYQSWIIGETVIRPDKKKVPKKVPMKRCFLRMSVYQNPFIPQSYIDTLKTLPRRERKRLLDGDWDYADDDSSLFKSGLIDKAITYELPENDGNFNKVIGVDLSDKGCFDDQTEILTDKGWRLFKDLSGRELVLSRNSDGVAQFEAIEQLHNYESDGQLYVYESRELSFAVTPNHKMLVRQSMESQENNQLIQIQNIKWKNYKVVRTHQYRCNLPIEDKQVFSFESRVAQPHGGYRVKRWSFNKNDWFEFLGWFVSEGSITVDRKYHRIAIAQKAGTDKFRHISELLKKMGIKHTTVQNNLAFYIEPIAKHLLQHVGKYAHKKRVPDYVTFSDDRQALERFLDGYCDGDGTRRKGRRLSYVTSSRSIADSLQIILANMNKAGKMTVAHQAGSTSRIEGRVLTRKHDAYCINERVRTTDTEIGQTRHPELTPYTGRIYCVSTKHQTIFVRRKGTCYWTGNSDATVFSLIDNGVLIAQKKSSIQMNWDRNSEEPLGYLIANELIEFAQRNGFQQVNARNIAVESNGIGASCRDALRVRGWNLTEYVATSKSRSEGYYNLMLNMDSGTIKIYKDVSTLGELRKELGAHTYEMENQEPKVIKKSKLKETLGRSPDVADSFMIASWMWDRKVNPQRDPKRNSKRISW